MRIAITGGIAEGKSTVLGYLRDLGYSVVSSDEVGREVFDLPLVQRGLRDIVGSADRIFIRSRLGDPEIRRELNRLTHPLILQRLHSSNASFFEVPLLIEICLQADFDRVWVVTCGEREQLGRLSQRLKGESEAISILRSQLPTRAKIPFADRIIRTNQAEASVMRCVSMAAQRDLQ